MAPLLRVAFVTGGSGFVGHHLLTYLRQRGVAVRALVRSERAAQIVQQLGAEPIHGSLHDTQALQDSMRACNGVFHLAARTGSWGRYEDFYQDNVVGVEHLLAAARAAGVPRLVHVSTEAMLAGGAPLVNVDETRARPARAAGLYGQTKGLAEERVRQANGPDLTTVVVRPRFIWGPGMPALSVMTQMVRSGSFLWIDQGHYLTSTCHVSNVCEGLLLAAEKGKGGAAYFLTDGDPVEVRTFLRELVCTQGIEPGTRSIPGWLARTLAGPSEGIWRVLRLKGEPPLTREMVALIGQEVTVSDALARRELGYQGTVTREEGLRELSLASRAVAASEASSPLSRTDGSW